MTMWTCWQPDLYLFRIVSLCVCFSFFTYQQKSVCFSFSLVSWANRSGQGVWVFSLTNESYFIRIWIMWTVVFLFPRLMSVCAHVHALVVGLTLFCLFVSNFSLLIYLVFVRSSRMLCSWSIYSTSCWTCFT